ncbi:hypothetical protein BDZ45DRAFT_766738 [Acephala macrosclerotiorum]|nr:hypothetical protein BDZ45DRAFT_766738 [Acephala macrosclerotiorum]
MCLFGRAPEWEEDVTFANRRHGRKQRTRITETTISRSPKYVPPRPRSPSPIIKPPTPPPKSPTPKPIVPSPPSQPTIELVSVEEDRSTTTGPRSSRVSVSKKSRHGSRGGEEVYIERERVRERLTPPEPEYNTFRYVEAPMPPRVERRGDEGLEERVEKKRSRSITYQTNPRTSGRLTERERVVVEDGGRRREYYRKP